MKASLAHQVFALALLALMAGCGGTGGGWLANNSTPGIKPIGPHPVAADNRGYVRKGYDYVASSVSTVFSAEKSAERVAKQDAISLSKPSNPGPDLYVKLAQVAERSGNFAAAETQYQRALKADPNYLEALLGYARMQDTHKRFDQAVGLYQEAVRRHPQDATAHNDLGLCLARRGNLDGALVELSQAVQLQPAKALYRNNVSTVLVQQGRYEEAFQHLSKVHPPAVAYYNLAFLLRQQGNAVAAREHFARALQVDPSFAAAQRHLAELGGPTPPAVAQSAPAAGAAQPVAHQQPVAPRFGR